MLVRDICLYLVLVVGYIGNTPLIQAQLNVTASNNAAQMAQLLAGQGVVVKNATLNCAGTAAGTFDGGVNALNFTLDEGIVLGTGNVTNANAGGLLCLGTDHGRPGYAPLNSIANATTQDACILEFDVEVTTSTLEFKYVFGSDEYPEYVGSSFNDAFGFYISGPGIAGIQNIGVLPGGGGAPITINTVNNGDTDIGPCINCEFYRADMSSQTQLDGTTSVLTATASVIPCETYHFVLAIADASDGCWDSSVFLEKSSLVSVGVDMTEPVVSGNIGPGRIYENCDSAVYTFHLPNPVLSDYVFEVAIKGTAQNGVDYRFLKDSMVIKAGEQSASYTILPLTDSIVDPGETVEICILDPCTKAELSCETVTIEELEAEITEEQNICYGDSVQLQVSENVNYNYSWSPGNSLSCTDCHNPIAFPNDTTTYFVTFSDQGCSLVREVTVNVAAPSLPTLADTTACIGATKSVDVSTPGFDNYLWTPEYGISSSSSPSVTFTVLDSAVSYMVIATNDLGCELTEEITITPFPAVEATLFPKDVLCFGDASGEIDVVVHSSSPIDSFKWQDGSFAADRVDLFAGDYEVELVDINGCKLILDTVVNQPDTALFVEALQLVPSRCGGPSGRAEGVAFGGTEPYQFQWSQGGDQSISESLLPGVYELTVIDANGCTASDTVEIKADFSDQKDAEIIPFGPFCAGSETFQIQTLMTGGVFSGPGVDSWGLFDPSAAGEGVHAIVHEIVDGYCSDRDTFFVEVSSSFQADINPINPPCALEEMVQLSSVTNGGLYWGTGILDSAFARFYPSHAGPGKHWIYHLVQGECGELDSMEIEVIAPDTGEIVNLPSFCPAGDEAPLVATPNGGTWSGLGVNQQVMFNPRNLGSGRYQVQYIPAAACRIPVDTFVTVVDTLKLTSDVDSTTCFLGSDGSVTLEIMGGLAPFSFDWDPAITSSTSSASNLGAGSYTVQVIDSLGCNAQHAFFVHQPEELKITNVQISNASCSGLCDGEAKIEVQGGTAPFTYSIQPSLGTTSFDGVATYSGLCGGNTFVVFISDANGCTVDTAITISEPTAISVIDSIVPANCNQSNGAIYLNTISGGSTPYSFLWSNNALDTHLVNVVPGSYSLDITDANGCTYSFPYNIDNIAGPSTNLFMDSISCSGGSDGKAWVQIVGGTKPFVVLWSNGSSKDTVNNLSAGLIEVSVVDSAGCEALDSIQILAPTPVILSDIVDTLLCTNEIYQGSFIVTGGNGTNNYRFEINGITQSTANFSLADSGLYLVRAFDNKNCPSNTIDFQVAKRGVLQVSIPKQDSICPGDKAWVSADVQGGKQPYQLNWNSGETQIGWMYQSSPTDSGSATTKLWVVDACNDVDSAVSAIDFYPRPIIQPLILPNSGCEPLTSNFSLPLNTFGEVKWFVNRKLVSRENVFNHEFVSAGSYDIGIEVISNQGCENSLFLEKEIVVYPNPYADISINPSRLSLINNEAFLGLSSTYKLAKAFWSISNELGDTIITTSGLQPFVVFPKIKGDYAVSASFETEFGCLGQSHAFITLASEDILYIPTAFTPNGDGVNDAFAIEVVGVEPSAFSVHIFDRWGEELFSSKDPFFKWDGSYLGELCKGDVYVWAIRYKTLDGKQKNLSGRVTLVR
ncbi:choice-of-anchor L domain-containing protein [Luteibaculum oceani]|uniref:T9SS type B sorting domain-containing protein n=1 Tax=Luteibaculum oceani TaxID=1294296 RepID=A0A5C6UZD1_9FLAO|nr:choice-of-anchor L domain-containing protein [Luteibaculum oceani]TXC78627.1 T9SS type B sorting domain-containing protein [Luteibaculum oceani]